METRSGMIPLFKLTDLTASQKFVTSASLKEELRDIVATLTGADVGADVRPSSFAHLTTQLDQVGYGRS
jgi:hypothetical protein